LSENVQDRLAALDIGRGAGSDDEELARLGGIRIAEYRRGDVALSVPACSLASSDAAAELIVLIDRWIEPGIIPPARPSRADLLAAEHDFAHGGVIRQHADDELAVEQVIDIRRWPETGRLVLADLIRAANIGDYPTPRRHEVCSHRRSHVTKADKTDFTLQRPASGRSAAAATLASRNPGCAFGS